MQPLSLIFAGAGEFGVPTLGALLGAGHRVVRVYSQPDRPAGRGRKLTPAPLARFALERGLDVVRTADLNAEALPAADLMVVIAFGQKIAEAVVHHPRLGSINLHASRLPKYRGAAPINWAVIDGEAVTGNSIIRVAPRMDAGAVLGMTEVRIGELETAGELHDRLAEDGAPLMLRVVEELGAGRAVEAPQDDTKATRALKLSRESTVLDWGRPAEELGRKVRGMYPWPGCRVRVVDPGGREAGRVTLVRARVGRSAGGAAPGTIDADGHVVTGDGVLEVVEVQPEGKRPMGLAAYRNGHPWGEGWGVESLV